MLKGIYYNQSRYVRGGSSFNIQTDWAYEFEGLSNTDYTSNAKRRYLLSDDIAEYYDSKGRLKIVNKANLWENDKEVYMIQYIKAQTATNNILLRIIGSWTF